MTRADLAGVDGVAAASTEGAEQKRLPWGHVHALSGPGALDHKLAQVHTLTGQFAEKRPHPLNNRQATSPLTAKGTGMTMSSVSEQEGSSELASQIAGHCQADCGHAVTRMPAI